MFKQKWSKTKPPKGVLLNTGHPLAKGLVGAWLMNEGGGNKIYDLSGNRNTGTFGGDTKWVPGKFGSCLSFDGSGDYVLLVPLAGGWSQVTLSVWIYATTSNNGDFVFNYAPSSGLRNDGAVKLAWSSNYDLITFSVYNEAVVTASHSEWINTNQWNLVVGTYDGSYVRIYINGKLGWTWSPGALTGNVRAGTDRTTIGSDGDYTPTYSWNGFIDNVMFYNRALSAAEVHQLYREPFCMFDKARLWGVVALPSVENAVFFGTEF